MRPLTDHVPKPLLRAGGKPLIVWHLEKLAGIGVREVVINTSWLADQFAPALGDGSQWGLRLHYSFEGREPLETGGGMLHALEILGPDAPFMAINGDVWSDYDLAHLPRDPEGQAHLVMVENPEHHLDGDFSLDEDGKARVAGTAPLTFAGIGVYRPALLRTWGEVINDDEGTLHRPPRFKLAPLLRAAMARGLVTGEYHRGQWTDVGTPQRLDELDAALRRSTPDAETVR